MLISVLGPLEVTSDGQPVDVRGAKQRALLEALALEPGRVVTTAALVDALWGDDPPPSARNSLQTYVARLRDALGAQVITTRPPGYALAIPPEQVDAVRFESLVQTGHRVAGTDPDQAAQHLDAALALWRGTPVPDLADAVGTATRTALQARRRRALHLRAETALLLGDLDDAVVGSTDLVAEDGLDEPAALLQSRALAAVGRVPEALAALDRLRTSLAEQLGIDPTAAVDELRRALLVGDPRVVAPAGLAGSAVRDPAPRRPASPGPPRAAAARAPQRTTFVGRGAELEQVLGQLEDERLVTLVGPGGVGTTRLAQEVAARWQAEHPHDPLWWVDLAPAGGEAVAARVAEVMGLDASGPTPAVLRAALAAAPGLLVLDSCEHVLDAVAELVDGLPDGDSPSRVLATSRAPLALPGERRVDVRPLGVDTPAAPAVQLLHDRAHAAGVDLGPDDEAAARQVCAALDGLPLAIELAAARLPAIGVQDLADRLGESLDVVDGPRRGGVERHRTLRLLVGWSLDLLDDVDRLLFDRLSVFAGTFELGDAEAVAADAALPRRAVDHGLVQLVERSLLVGPGAHGGSWYRMLGPLRSVAAERLDERGEREVVTARLTAHLRTLVADAEQAADTSDDVRMARRLDAALDDLRALQAHARETGDEDVLVELAAGLGPWAYWRSRVDVLTWGEHALGSGHPRAAGALASAAAAAWQRGALAEAATLVEQARAAAADATGHAAVRDAARVDEAAGDVALLAGRFDEAAVHYRAVLARTTSACAAQHAAAHGNLALTAAYAGDLRAAERHADDAVLDADAIGAQTMQAFARYCRGEALTDVRPDDALADLQQAHALAETCGARLIAGLATTAEVALRGRHGAAEVALDRYDDAVDRWVAAGALGLLWTVMRNLVVLLSRIGSDADAVALAVALEGGEVGKRADGAEATRLARALRSATDRLAADEAERARARGLAATGRHDAVVALARASISAARSRMSAAGTSR